jgi:hypothetical protein
MRHGKTVNRTTNLTKKSEFLVTYNINIMSACMWCLKMNDCQSLPCDVHGRNCESIEPLTVQKKIGFLRYLLFVLKVDAVLQSRRNGNPTTGGKHVIPGTLVYVVNEVGAGEQGAKKEGNDNGSPLDALEAEKYLVPCLRTCKQAIAECENLN